jgi:quinol monooxygenase YgiN
MAEEIVVAGWIDWEPAHRDTALAHLREAARHSRAEPGCLDYSMTADPDDERRIRVFERWSSAEALDEHLRTPHIAAFRAATADLVRLDRSLDRIVIASHGPVG